MVDTARHDAWQAGDKYEQYMGRWSRRVAPRFLDWIAAPRQARWLEVGCGTGALTEAVVSGHDPACVVAIDPSAGFLETARRQLPDPRVTFRVGDAVSLEVESGSQDVVVSGLALNFVPDRAKALAEMRRAARSQATVAFYVWDYPGGGLQFLRAFWNAATSLDPEAAELTEDRRFPFCTRGGLADLATAAGLLRVETTPIEIECRFSDFDDYWRPFTLGAGPAPGYCASLSPEARERLRTRLKDTLPIETDGSITLLSRAWAVCGAAP